MLSRASHKPHYFLTAIGTGIGKTFVTASLCYALRSQKALGLKPVISGYDAGEESDIATLLAAQGRQMPEDISLYRFKAPLSPDIAAAREGAEIDTYKLLEFCREKLRAAPGPVFIEGVGGVMVPLHGAYTTLDWMQALGLKVILVSSNYLGAISHTLTALEALQGRGIKQHALVINDAEEPAISGQEMQQALAKFTDVPAVLQPRIASTSKPWQNNAAIEGLIRIV